MMQQMTQFMMAMQQPQQTVVQPAPLTIRGITPSPF